VKRTRRNLFPVFSPSGVISFCTIILILFLALGVPSIAGALDWTTPYAGVGRASYLAQNAAVPPFALAWETEIPQPLMGGPIIMGALGKVYVVSQRLNVWALELKDGSLAWKYDAPRAANEVKSFNAITGSPVWTRFVDGDLIHVPQVGMTAVYVSTNKGRLYAFAQTDGKPLWSMDVGGKPSLPASDAGLVVVYTGSLLLGFAPRDGAVLFRKELGSSMVSVPVLDGEDVYVSTVNEVVALSRNGKEAWRAGLGKPAWAPMAVTRGGVVVASVDGNVSLLSRTDGHEIWKTRLAGTPNTVAGAGETVYIGTRQGSVVGLRLLDGAKDVVGKPG